MVEWNVVTGRAIELVKEYNAQFIRPTLRQIHYRLASEQVGGYQNTRNCYKRLSEKLVEARKQGLIPWDSLADHVRYRRWNRPFGGQVPEYVDLESLLESYVVTIGEDPWKAQGLRVIVWLEKDALAELIEGVTWKYYVPLAVSRGYSSWTFIYDNLDVLRESGTRKVVLYLGDHDPSGLDIERFTKEAMQYFKVEFDMVRIAVTYEQVKKYNLLPNPTKKADPRAKWYIQRYGDKCWELDAIEPRELKKIVEESIKKFIKEKVWNEVMKRNEESKKEALEKLKEIIKERKVIE